jgi:CubicO group peptidase (beta-lactamase class C family)
VSAQPTKPTLNIPELDRVCARLLQQKLASGVVCLLAAGRGQGLAQLIHVGAQGFTRAQGGSPTTKDTLFDVGGLTETFATSNIAMMLVASGKLQLGTVLGKVLPAAAQGPLANVTLAALMDHSAGLPQGDAEIALALRHLPDLARPMVKSAGHQTARITHRLVTDKSGTVSGEGPFNAESVARFKAEICRVQPEAPAHTRFQHSVLGPMLLGWALEAVTGKPLDVLLRTWVVKPIMPKETITFLRNGALGPLQSLAMYRAEEGPAATLTCPWRHRALVGEAQDKAAWALGGVAGHSGLFASGDGLMRLALGLHFSALGVVRYVHAGTLSRFWAKSTQMPQSPFTLGWMVACRQNGMLPGRWHSRSVGQISPQGSALFIDPASNVVGLVLANLGAHGNTDTQGAWATVRGRIFDTMASYGQNLPPANKPR